MKNPEKPPSKAAAKRVRVFGIIFVLGLPALIALGGFFIWTADSPPTSQPTNQADALVEEASDEDASDEPAVGGEDVQHRDLAVTEARVEERARMAR